MFFVDGGFQNLGNSGWGKCFLKPVSSSPWGVFKAFLVKSFSDAVGILSSLAPLSCDERLKLGCFVCV